MTTMMTASLDPPEIALSCKVPAVYTGLIGYLKGRAAHSLAGKRNLLMIQVLIDDITALLPHWTQDTYVPSAAHDAMQGTIHEYMCTNDDSALHQSTGARALHARHTCFLDPPCRRTHSLLSESTLLCWQVPAATSVIRLSWCLWVRGPVHAGLETLAGLRLVRART